MKRLVNIICVAVILCLASATFAAEQAIWLPVDEYIANVNKECQRIGIPPVKITGTRSLPSGGTAHLWQVGDGQQFAGGIDTNSKGGITKAALFAAPGKGDVRDFTVSFFLYLSAWMAGPEPAISQEKKAFVLQELGISTGKGKDEGMVLDYLYSYKVMKNAFLFTIEP